MPSRKKEPPLPSPLLNEGGSFPALYREFASLVRAVIYRIAGHTDLDDLVQEAFVRIWKYRKDFEGRSSLKTWIYRIATNVAVDHARRQKKWIEFEEAHTGMQGGNSSHLSHRDLVKKVLRELSPSHRAVLILQALEGLSVQEISQIMEIPEGTVKSKLFYAKQKALELLQAEGVSL